MRIVGADRETASDAKILRDSRVLLGTAVVIKKKTMARTTSSFSIFGGQNLAKWR